mgnify:CR=1 FL=1
MLTYYILFYCSCQTFKGVKTKNTSNNITIIDESYSEVEDLKVEKETEKELEKKPNKNKQQYINYYPYYNPYAYGYNNYYMNYYRSYNNPKIDINPISINLSGTIKLDAGSKQFDISKEILNNPQLITRLTEMINKQINILEYGSFNKNNFKQKFV